LTKARCNCWLNEIDFAQMSRYKEKRWDLRCLYSSGGVPSSHSATVMGLAVAIGLGDGLGGPLLAIAFVLASVVCLFNLSLFVPHTKGVLTYFYGVITSELYLLTCLYLDRSACLEIQIADCLRMGLQVMYDASGVHLQAGRQAEVF